MHLGMTGLSSLHLSISRAIGRLTPSAAYRCPHSMCTGRINVLGQKGLRYQDGKEDDTVWPPKYMKFVLHLTDPDKGDVVQIAFSDPRRLGRIRLRADPVNEPPLSLLGPDPIVSPPTAEVWHAALTKRRSPIKSVLLDQAVCASLAASVAVLPLCLTRPSASAAAQGLATGLPMRSCFTLAFTP